MLSVLRRRTGIQDNGADETSGFARRGVGELYALLAVRKLDVFIERDGVLNKVRVERQSQITPSTVPDFKIKEDAAPLLKKLKAAGFTIIVTTNQPGLSRGYLSRREL